MRNKERILFFLAVADLLLVILVLLARMILLHSYSCQAFTQPGLFHDEVCSNGSYEMIECPFIAPPYETLMVILVIFEFGLVWEILRRKK